MTRIRGALKTLHWAALSLFLLMLAVFLFGDEALNEGNSSLATLLVVIALTGIVWVPILGVAALVSLYLEIQALLERTRPLYEIIKTPALYVLLITLVLLVVMFA